MNEILTSPDTFAACKAADLLTTHIALVSGLGIEGNPIVAGLLSHGWIPVLALSFFVWKLIEKANEPIATATANVITCGAAFNNFLLIVR